MTDAKFQQNILSSSGEKVDLIGFPFLELVAISDCRPN